MNAKVVKQGYAATFGGNMDLRERISRWVLAIGLWGCALWMVRYGWANFEFLWLLGAAVVAFIGLSRVFTDLLEMAAKPFTMLVDAIVFPKMHAGKPPPNYKLAEYYVEEGRWEEAEDEYRIILKNHRRETRAYLGLIRLLMEQGEKEEGQRIYNKARRNLKNIPDELSDVEMEWHHLAQ